MEPANRLDFITFKEEFTRYQELFGLEGYRVYFKYEPSEDNSFADITANQEDMSAVVKLNSKLSDINSPHKDIKLSAKHEAIHLLISRLELNGKYRFVSAGELYESAEELVHRLEKLIP